jgi:hypothetical protein
LLQQQFLGTSLQTGIETIDVHISVYPHIAVPVMIGSIVAPGQTYLCDHQYGEQDLASLSNKEHGGQSSVLPTIKPLFFTPLTLPESYHVPEERRNLHWMRTTLVLIKIIHTLIWVFFNVVIFYLLYAVIVNRIDKWVWIALGLIVLEGLVLLIFKNVCPVTIVAQRYSVSTKANFDIYLPEWLARHNKTIYTGIVVVALVILVWRLVG